MIDAVRGGARRIDDWRTGADGDPRHDARTAAVLGISLGVCFTICFLTGLYSHLAQHPPAWFTLPARPAGLYRVTQGLHVATGIAAIPLLFAKLWAVFPRLFQWPPVSGVAHLLERLTILPLVAGGLFLVWSGVANIDLWYPLPFFFPAAHYWVAWITIGALVTHIGAKLTTTRTALARRNPNSGPHPESKLVLPSHLGADMADQVRGRGGEEADPVRRGWGRREFLLLAGGGSALLTLATAGQAIEPLKELALLAPRSPTIGVQGFPVNKTAAEAGVVESAADVGYRLDLIGGDAVRMSLSVDDLRSLPQHSATLPIACVEGWSASRTWTGVRVRDVAGLIDGAARAVTVRSLEGSGLYAQSDLNADQAADPDTLLALDVDGQPLDLDHGFPLRLIGPNRPGVMQTKWVNQLELR